MKKVTLLLSLAATVLSLASCEKELDNVSTPDQAATTAASEQTVEAKTSLLTTGDWKLASYVATTDQATTDLRVMLKADKHDNLTQFRGAGKLIMDEGQLKRDAETAQQTEGAWAFADNGQSLTITEGEVATTYSVAELTATTLRLVRSEAGTSGKPTTLTSVYSR